MRGRTPWGPEGIENLPGSAAAKQRLQVLLEVLCGRCRVREACARLGVKAARWAQLRQRAWRGALAALEPRLRGRRPRRRQGTAEQEGALAARVRELELALQLAQTRAEVAEIRGGVIPASPRTSRGRGTRRTAAATGDEEPADAGDAANDGEKPADAGNVAHPSVVVATPSVVHGNGPLLWRADQAVRRRRGHRGVRGWASQRPRRQAEAAVRDCLAAAGAWARQQGWRLPVVAARLKVSERSLRRWSARQRRVVARGRPVVRPPLAVRQDVLVQLAESGPGVSVTCLRAAFPHVPRAELVDLRGRYRRLCRQRGRGRMARLTWTQAGVVWAADFAWPPEVIEGRYPRLLSVRDLASGLQLAWRPVSGESAAETCGVLTGLFGEHGAPLVLKMDNGPAFHSEELASMLSPQGVAVLYSPAYTPSYNGSVEAGVGAMKGRTEMQAWLRGASGSWTWEDLEAARQEANAACVGRRESSPTRAQVWALRPRLDETARAALRAEVLRQQPKIGSAEAWTEKEASGGSVLDKGCPWRVVLRRALVALGYLVLSWRRIPLPIKPQKVDKIT
jgi:hypothetical protein